MVVLWVLALMLIKCWYRIKEVSSKPRKEYNPKPRMTLELLPPSESHNGGIHSAKSPGRSPGERVHVEMKGCIKVHFLNTRAAHKVDFSASRLSHWAKTYRSYQ